MKKFHKRSGAPFPEEKAQIYGNELDNIKKKHKKLQPNIIVEEAIKEESPLHEYFEWDNTEAAEKHRLQQARMLVSGIVEVVEIKGEPHMQRSFFNVNNKQGEKVYVTLKEISVNKDYTKQLLQKLQTQLNGASLTISMIMSFKD